MCFSLPAKVIKVIDKNYIQILHGNKMRKVKSVLLSSIKKNDWVLINANMAVSKITFEEAKIITKYFKKND